MSCNHKFQSYLKLERLQFEPKILIAGTFVPEWPATGQDDWFYGRTTSSYFWDVLPRLYGEPSLQHATPAVWKDFCREKRIALTDLISCIEDAEPANGEHREIMAGNADKAIAYNFDDFEFTSIIDLLRKHPTIKSVYLTRSITEAFWRHIWNPVMHYCSVHNIYERKLLAPWREAINQQRAHNEQQPGNQFILTEDYILWRWQQEWRMT